jgi:pyochelin synthetase
MLRGDTDPLELLFDDGELRTADAVYRDNDVMRQCNDVLAQAAANLVAASTEPLRVIELGAGTGASSASVLPVLDGHCSEYLFTDVSGYLVGQAGKRFSGYPFVRFGRYDVNLPPGLQGVRTHGYDLVIAANVMHDAPDSQDALRRAAQLLAPGGVLILIEGTGANRMQLVSLGLLEGLSAYQDDRSVTLSALRTAEAWTTQLKAAGFIAAQAWTGGVDHPVRALRQAVIAAQMPHQVQVLDVSAVRRYLGDRLPSYMMPTTVTSLDRIPLTPNGKVDRAALESAAVMPGLDAGDERPSTGTEPASWAEKLVATAWCRALGISAVNREDDYFDVGGDSLSGIRIVSWLREKSGVNLRIQDIFEARTVTALAAIIEDRQGHGHS